MTKFATPIAEPPFGSEHAALWAARRPAKTVCLNMIDKASTENQADCNRCLYSWAGGRVAHFFVSVQEGAHDRIKSGARAKILA